ncbi:hypothetical protein NQ315_009841 [Exocentrus adspersus]|uniref:Uncharacterized protein n=1 Tax=Exocentrus adspersus TaxID=1586481 RepID=A0AAV8WI92_9CUCU|nr:hypothetical protein NQ315_009841 [Exocentrus adspersus]
MINATYKTLPIQRDSPSDMWRYLEILDNALMEINIDTTSCLQRSLCSTVRASSKNVNDGNGSSMDKIIDGLASNEWLQRFMSETPFYAAMKSGLRDSDCGREYDKCTVSKGALNMILKKLAGLVHGQGQNKDMFS